jgi:hypothetical protein
MIMLWKTYPQKTILTYYEAKERILNLPSNHCSPSRALSKNSKPQHEANAVSVSNGKKDKKKKKGLPPLPIRAVRSATGGISTHQALCPVIFRHSVKSSKHGEIEIVPKWRLPSRKSLIL